MHKYNQITLGQRQQIEVLVRMKTSKPKIAKLLGVHRSTVYRELNRNSGNYGSYNANYAQVFANDRKERLRRPRKLDSLMEKQIRECLSKRWSPEQIHGYYTSLGEPMLSHEQIYKYIYMDRQNGGQLYKYLRIASKPYRPRYGTKTKRSKIPNRIGIDQRPDIVDKRIRIGDWEADTIV